MIRALGRTAIAAVLLGAVLLASGSAAWALDARASCSTAGLSSGHGKGAARVVGISVNGLSCHAGRLIASEVAHDLAQGESISIANASGYSMSEVSSCASRCESKTEVSIDYPHGSIDVSIGGAASGGASVTIPNSGVSPGGLLTA